MKKALINDLSIAYERRGKGMPLVLVHGFPLDHTSWNEAAPLLENKFDIIMPDLRGFGQSTTVDAPYSLLNLADDIAGLLKYLGLDKVALAGHSMGGYVALAFVKKYPARVSALGLVSSQAAADTPERKEGRYKTAAEVAEKGVSVVADAMTPRLSADARVQSIVRDVILQQSRAGVTSALKAMAEREDMSTFLSLFPSRLVLIHGDADQLIPIDRSKEIKLAVPTAKIVELGSAGHMPMMEFAMETAEGLNLLSG